MFELLSAPLLFVLFGSCIVLSTVITLTAIYLGSEGQKSVRTLIREADEDVVFLFEDQTLVDVTEAGWRVIDDLPGGQPLWPGLIAHLGERYPDLPHEVSDIVNEGHMVFRQPDADRYGIIEAEWLDGMIRISVFDQVLCPARIQPERITDSATKEAFDHLKEIVNHAPFPIWAKTDDGKLSFANAAYRSIADLDNTDNTDVWTMRTVEPVQTTRARAMLETNNAKPNWYEDFTIEHQNGEIHYAPPADGLVAVEQSLSKFRDTLTKTFAHLSVGLVVFDEKKELALFNPAIMDLTSLPADFLSNRPTLFAFLDRLRETRMMPEPRNYRAYCDALNQLEAEVAEGTYNEIWTLEDGRTYRISGRPHPESALALMFEDITSEINLTRSLRSDLELGQSVIDGFDEGMIVFSADGKIAMTNQAYCDMWKVDPSTSFVEMTVLDAMRLWQLETKPNEIFGEIRNSIGATQMSEWSGEIMLLDGRKLMCRLVPLAGGASLVGFTKLSAHVTDFTSEVLARSVNV